jgi:hypothetical protein
MGAQAQQRFIVAFLLVDLYAAHSFALNPFADSIGDTLTAPSFWAPAWRPLLDGLRAGNSRAVRRLRFSAFSPLTRYCSFVLSQSLPYRKKKPSTGALQREQALSDIAVSPDEFPDDLLDAAFTRGLALADRRVPDSCCAATTC